MFCSYRSNEEIIVIDLENLEINEEGIFFNQNGQWTQIRSLAQDSEGKLLGSTDWSFTWKCPQCDYENNPFRKKCNFFLLMWS